MLTVLAVLALGGSCTTSHFARPLGHGNAIVSGSVGGPLLLLGPPVPAPMVTVTGGYGFSDCLDGFARLGGTAGLFGNLHLESGVALHPVEGFSLAGSLHLFTDFDRARSGPQVTALFSWRPGASDRHLLYAGLDAGAWFPGKFRVVAGLLGGGEWRISERFGLSGEVKWLAPWYDVEPFGPTWLSPGYQGYVSVLFGLNVYFGGVR